MAHRYDREDVEDRNTARSSWPLYFLGGLFVAGVLSLAAWNIEIPYLAYSPGPVSDAADNVVTEGVPVFPPEGELLMLTVSSQDVNVFEAVIAGFDPTIDLVRRERVRPPDETDEQYRERVLQQMDSSQEVAISVALSHLGHEMIPTGILVTEIREGTPASAAIEVGDRIESINGDEVLLLSDLTDALEGLVPGDVVDMGLIRAGSATRVTVELAERDDGSAMIGVTVHQLDEPPFPIRLETGVVGGPSAGMMQTLAIIDSLTEGEMTKGHVVAGTGTIGADGTIGGIGGIRQKVVAAEAAGAEYMLLPAGNYDSALTAERDDMELIPVGHVDEAIAFLNGLAEKPS
jgi:PDZ domain-containing protein